VPEHLHERLRKAAVPLGDGDDVAVPAGADDPVESLDPAAAVPREAVRLREPDKIRRAVRGDESIVEIDRGVRPGEQDFDRDGRGEADARG